MNDSPMDVQHRHFAFIDRQTVLERVGMNSELLKKLAGMFIQSVPVSLGNIAQALDQDDFERVAEEAHRLKGQVGFFTAGMPFQASRSLEKAAHEEHAEEAPAAFQEFDSLIGELIVELEEFVRFVTAA